MVCDVGDSLAEFAERGRRLEYPELHQFRRLLVGSHLLIYTIEAERVTLHAVMHSSHWNLPMTRLGARPSPPAKKEEPGASEL